MESIINVRTDASKRPMSFLLGTLRSVLDATTIQMTLVIANLIMHKVIFRHSGRDISYPYIFMASLILIPLLSYGMSSEYADTRVAYFKQQLESDTIPAEMKLHYYDSLMVRAPHELSEFMLGKAKVLRDMNGLNRTKEALQLYENISNMENMYPLYEHLETLYTIGELYLKVGDPLNSLRFAGRLLSYPTPDSLNYYKAKAYLNLSNIFVYLEEDDKLEAVVNNGLKLLENEKNRMLNEIYSLLRSGLLTRRAALLIVNENYSDAFRAFSEAKRLYPLIADRINVNIGGLFSTQQQHDIAQQYYMEALSSSTSSEIRGVAAFNMALGYFDRGMYDEFLNCINKYPEELSYWDNRLQGASLWHCKSEAYESLGDYKEALYAQRVADSIRNEVMPPEKIRELEREYVNITLGEKDAEMREVVKESGRKTVWLWVSGIMCFIAVGVIVWLLIRLRKHGDLIAEGEQVRRKEKEEYQQRKEEMDTTLELRNQEMSSMAMKLASLSEKMESLREIVSDGKSKKGDIVTAVQSTLREVSSDGEVWDAFMGYFEEVNQSFFDRLYRLHPDLTNAETRMCAFILLNRTNKEIATILHRSARTVETIKYNLRKKLGITEPTESYLRSISSGEKGTT